MSIHKELLDAFDEAYETVPDEIKYDGVKGVSKEILNKSYFNLHPTKPVSKEEFKAMYPPINKGEDNE